jgi:putative transposase
LVREIRANQSAEIIKGHVSKGRFELVISAWPKVSVSKLVQLLKGRTSHELLRSSPALRVLCPGHHLWARGYLCHSLGDVADEMITACLENKNNHGYDGDDGDHGDDKDDDDYDDY